MNGKSALATCLLAASALLASAAAEATTVSYIGFSSTAGLKLVGSATTATTGDGTVLRLTPANYNQSGAAYSSSAITLGSSDTFSTRFQFRITDPGGADPADGITFVLAASPTGLGAAGYGLGYNGVSNSVAIEFDMYDNGNVDSLGFFPAEPDSGNHVAIDTGGALTDTNPVNVYGNASCGFATGTPPQNPYTAAGCMSNGDLWTATINYNGADLSATLSDPAKGSAFTVYSNYGIDIGSYLGTDTAYVGFTGSTGAGYQNQDIVNWEFANTATLPPTVPEPSTLPLFGAGLICLGILGVARVRRRRLGG